MLLALDMGNTNIVVGCMDNGKIVFDERLGTDVSKTPLEYAMGIKAVLELHNVSPSSIHGAILSSVVPPLTNVIKLAIKKTIGIDAMVVGPGIKTGLNIKMDNPKALGADLVVDAVAGISEYGAPLIIIDMGTATTISVVDDKSSYIGGMIVPGVGISVKALVERTAQLPDISLEAPKKAIGTNTIDCMRSGVMLGQAALLDGLIDRIEEEMGMDIPVVATGGIAKSVIPVCRHNIMLDNELLLKGLNIIYNKNA